MQYTKKYLARNAICIAKNDEIDHTVVKMHKVY